MKEIKGIKTNWKTISKEVFIGFVIVLILTYMSAFYSVIVLNKDALKSLIEAEATILGFFGLIIVYILTSFDTKEDRYEQQLFELSEKGKFDKVSEFQKRHWNIVGFKGEKPISKGEIIVLKITNLRKKRQIIVRYGSAIGILLVCSLLLSIFILGTIDIAIEVGIASLLGVIITILSGIAIYTFFLSVLELFRMFRGLSKTS